MSEAPDRPGAARSASAPVSGAVPAAPTGPVRWDKSFAIKVLADMVRIRRMEERCAELYGKQKIRGFLHLYIGEEAVAAGSLNALTIRRASASAAADGENTSLARANWVGWIRVLPSKPIARP